MSQRSLPTQYLFHGGYQAKSTPWLEFSGAKPVSAQTQHLYGELDHRYLKIYVDNDYKYFLDCYEFVPFVTF